MNIYGSGLNNHTEALTNSIRNNAMVEEVYKDKMDQDVNFEKKSSLWNKALSALNNVTDQIRQ